MPNVVWLRIIIINVCIKCSLTTTLISRIHNFSSATVYKTVLLVMTETDVYRLDYTL